MKQLNVNIHYCILLYNIDHFDEKMKSIMYFMTVNLRVSWIRVSVLTYRISICIWISDKQNKLLQKEVCEFAGRQNTSWNLIRIRTFVFRPSEGIRFLMVFRDMEKNVMNHLRKRLEKLIFLITWSIKCQMRLWFYY